MKLVLISPPRTRLASDPIRTGTPLGLLSLAAMVRKHLPQIEVHFIDAMAEGRGEQEIKPGLFRYGLTQEELRGRLSSIGPDVVGVSNIFTSEWQSAAFCAGVAKEACPGVKVVMGGHHPTYEPAFMLKHAHADFVVLGEGELAFLELLKAIAEKRTTENEPRRIPGIAFKGRNLLDGGGIVKTPCPRPPSSLDELEDPAFDLLQADLYLPGFSHSGPVPPGKKALADFSISRGCPIDCNFCTSTRVWGKGIRTFSSERVREQVRVLRKEGFDHASIEDDQVLMIPEAPRWALFEELGHQGFSWEIDAGIYYPLLTEEFAARAAGNGCRRIFMPIEHPALEIMHGEHKYGILKSQESVQRAIAKACTILRNRGIEFYVAMIVGFKQETEATLAVVRNYARFAMAEGAAWVNFFYPKPLPGTKDYENYGAVPAERKWETAPEFWAFSTAVLKPDAMRIEELVAKVDAISTEVNGRPNALSGSVDGQKKRGGQNAA